MTDQIPETTPHAAPEPGTESAATGVKSPPPSWAEGSRFVPRSFVQPALSFMRTEAAGGIAMLVAAIVAIAWANSPVAESYFALFGTHIEIAFGSFHFHHLSDLTVQEWVNDGLMAIFFFVVGLEIKRELVVGELRDPRAAALPALAALGGMIVPAAIYIALNRGTAFGHGWGIPMATDIAFAVGIVSLVGRKVSISAKLFLLALAIVDDLGAILVIAIFYTEEVAFLWLLAAGASILLVVAMRRLQVRSLAPYLVVGCFTWLAVLESGVHATVAGVAMGLLAPTTSFYNPRYFPGRARKLVERVEEYLPDEQDLRAVGHHTMERVNGVMGDIRRLTRETLPPLDRAELALTKWSSFVIVPLFALANAGVALKAETMSAALTNRVTLGVFLGLVIGKVVGVVGFAWVAIKLGLGKMPRRTNWRQIIGVGMLSGVGFTVALFVSALSFPDEPGAADFAKIGIFAGSLLAGGVGFFWLRSGPEIEGEAGSH